MQMGNTVRMLGVPQLGRVTGHQAHIKQVAAGCTICQEPRARSQEMREPVRRRICGQRGCYDVQGALRIKTEGPRLCGEKQGGSPHGCVGERRYNKLATCQWLRASFMGMNCNAPRRSFILAELQATFNVAGFASGDARKRERLKPAEANAHESRRRVFPPS